MHPVIVLQLLMLLMLANGTPVIAKKMFGGRYSYPLDGNLTFADGQPVFGRSKTIRGIVLAVLVTTASAPIIGLGWKTGLLVGSFAMAGDLFSSFCKRRLGLPSSSRASGLDQIPESLLPVLACRDLLALTAADVVVCVVIFVVGEVVLSRLLYAFHLRDRPY
jgi:CDP-2,3-bis-(O-geranylgeranyl)-sn-glycerol synthase